MSDSELSSNTSEQIEALSGEEPDNSESTRTLKNPSFGIKCLSELGNKSWRSLATGLKASGSHIPSLDV